MNSWESVAAVTAVVKALAEHAARRVGTGARATSSRPDKIGKGSVTEGINVFLFLVRPNAAATNRDLPLRNGAGQRTSVPVAAVDLEFVLTCFGEKNMEPEKLLGSLVALLHAYSVFDADVRPFLTHAPDRHLVERTGLLERPDPVRLSRTVLDLEEFHRLWSTFHQATYQPSLRYTASVVYLPEDLSVIPPLPAVKVNQVGRPTGVPTADACTPARATTGDRVTVRGSFGSAPTGVAIGGVVFAPPGSPIANVSGVTVPTITGTWFEATASWMTVRLASELLQSAAVGPGWLAIEPVLGSSSPLARAVLAPSSAPTPSGQPGTIVVPRLSITQAGPGGRSLTIAVDPPAQAWQEPRLLLDPFGLPPGRSGASLGPDAAPTGTAPLSFTVPAEVEAGDYVARLQFGGTTNDLERAPGVGPKAIFNGPKVSFS